jgi:hypothetical protein
MSSAYEIGKPRTLSLLQVGHRFLIATLADSRICI